MKPTARRLVRFAWLSASDRCLLVRAIVLERLAEVAVGRISVPATRRLLGAVASLGPGRTVTTERVAWAVAVASRVFPRPGACLPRALATEALLRRAGADARLRLGLGRSDDGRLVGHAWIESHDRIVVGGEERGRYAPLPDLEPSARATGPWRA